MFDFFLHIKDVITFVRLPKEARRLVFYSEGKSYWPHLGGLVRQVLSQSDMQVVYVSSNKDDPGLFLKHPSLKSFLIDEGFIRDWFFENIETDVMVMTMPDLDQYQVKRSKNNVHYVYVQHSLLSLHTVYREGAFDHYDTVFCSGPHHVNEMKAIMFEHNLNKKQIVEHGYARLDSIISEAKKNEWKMGATKGVDGPCLHGLIAPSWGDNGLIESGKCLTVVKRLLSQNCKVTLRPHPETIKHSFSKIDEVISEYGSDPLFEYEDSVVGQSSLHNSDFMVSDWSGAAFDYGFGLGKPVLFMDLPRKINNPNHEKINLIPFEVSMREEVGVVVDPDLIDVSVLQGLSGFNVYNSIYNLGNSDVVGAKEIISLCALALNHEA